MTRGCWVPVVLVIFGACSGDGTGGVGPDPVTAGPPASMLALTGQGQTATVANELPEALSVVLRDSTGLGVAGRSVTFAVTAGGGSMFLGSAVTDSEGRAADRWVLGTVAGGAQKAEARLVDAETGRGFIVDFTATALPGAPGALTAAAGDGQIGLPAQPLTDSLAVKAKDSYGNATPGVSVVWSVSGGGAVSPGVSPTDAAGIARTRWVLGPVEGVAQRASATLGELPPVEFTAAFRSSSWDFGAGVWQTVADLPVAVRAPTAATDGSRLFVFGGYTTQGLRSSRTQIFDPDTGEWTLGADMPVALDFGFAVAVPDGLHVLGGVVDGVGRSSRHFIYHPDSDSWTETGLMPIGVSAPAGGVVDGKLYLVGGVTGGATRHEEVQVFDPTASSWSFGAPYPLQFLNGMGEVIGDTLHVAGGGLAGYGTSSAYFTFSPDAGSWSAGPTMPARREAAGAGTTAGNFCVFGGRLARSGGFNTPWNDTFCFDRTGRAWRTASPMPTARAELASVSLDGWIYAIGGHDGMNRPMSTVERFTGEGGVVAYSAGRR